MPFSAFSSGTVTSSRPPSADRPEARRSGSRPGRRELGEDVDRACSAAASKPKNIIADGRGDHEEAELQARADDPAHHGRSTPSQSAVARRHLMPNSAPHSSAPPVVTTAVPAWRSRGEHGLVAVDALDGDRLADVASGRRGWCRRRSSRPAGRAGPRTGISSRSARLRRRRRSGSSSAEPLGRLVGRG